MGARVLKQLPEAIAISPCPAVWVWPESDGPAWLANAAALAWRSVAVWPSDEWMSLAKAVLEATGQSSRAEPPGEASRSSEGEFVTPRDRAHSAHFSACPLEEGGVIAWLRAPEDGVLEKAAAFDADDAYVHLSLAEGLLGLALWRLDARAHRLSGNSLGFQMVGLVPARDGTVAPEAFYSVMPPDDRDELFKHLADGGRRDGVAMSEWRFRTPDGGSRTLKTLRIAQRDELGRTAALTGVSVDVTDLIAQRDRARESRINMNLIADATGIGIWRVDPRIDSLGWNRHLARLLDVDAAEEVSIERIGPELLKRVHPQDQAQFRRAIAALSQGSESNREEALRIVRPDGSVRWVVVRARRTSREPGGEVFGVLLDMTGQRELFDRMRQAEHRVELAARSVGLGIWEMDLATGRRTWDAQMHRLHGVDPADPRPPDNLRHRMIDADDLAREDDQLRQLAMRAPDAPDTPTLGRDMVLSVTWADGTTHWLTSRAMVVRDDNLTPTHLLGVQWDMTQQRRNDDMRREKQAAEEASRAKNLYLARTSHELRTPLNAILGFSQLLIADDSLRFDGTQMHRLHTIIEAGHQLQALIDDTLDVASIEAGSLSLGDEPVDLGAVITQALVTQAALAQRGGVRLSAGAQTHTALGDPRRVAQIVNSLLIHAVRHSLAGDRVQVRAVSDPFSAMVGVEVELAERQIAPAVLDRLLRAIDQLMLERSAFEGSGVGLSVARHFAERMGGRLEARVTPKAGTRWMLWLPMAPGDEAANDDVMAVDARTQLLSRSPIQAPHDLLYVEDDPINLLLVQELLSLRPGLRLHTAVDGAAGVAIARRLRPALIFLDLHLPDLDGFEILSRLRSDPSLAETPVIAISASVSADHAAQAAHCGFADYWTKPLDTVRFLHGLDEWVARLPRHVLN